MSDEIGGGAGLLRPSVTRLDFVALGLGLVVAAGMAIAVFATDRAAEAATSPIEPPGGWRMIFVVTTIVAFAAYAVGALTLLRARVSVVAVSTIAAAVQLVPLAGPTLLSTDVWTYWMYGRIAGVLGGNPFVTPPSEFVDDIAYGAMGSSWHDTTSLYGPLFAFDSELVARVAGGDADLAAFLFRAQAALAVLGIAAAAGALARNRAFAIAFVGWSPLLALHFAGGGHNDALMLLLVLCALLLGERGRVDLAGVSWVAAISIKWVPLAFLGLWLIFRWRRGLPLGLRGLAAGAMVLGIVATARYGLSWVDAVSGLSGQARRTGSLGLSTWLGDLGLAHRAQLVVIGIFVVTCFALLARAAWRGRLRLGLSGTLLALGQGWLNPWYGSWGVSLSAQEEDRVAHIAALALSAFLLLDAIPG